MIKLKVASVVFKGKGLTKCTPETYYEKIDILLSLASKNEIDLILFPGLIGNLAPYRNAFANNILSLSKKYPSLTICPGSFFEHDKDDIYHTSFIAKNGQILLRQRQIYLAKWEREIGLKRGIEAKLVDINGFKTGIVLSTDTFYPQVARYLALNGAELILSPAAIKAQKNSVFQLSGLWQSVQQNLFFAMDSGFKGTFLDMEFHSHSFIYAPLAMTEKEDGFLAKENNDHIITAVLDKEKRVEAMKKFNPLKQLNSEFYKDMFK